METKIVDLLNKMPKEREKFIEDFFPGHKYTFNNLNLFFKMLKYWQTNVLDYKEVQKQHPGAWGPWYHWSLYVLNPLTQKYFFVKELRRATKYEKTTSISKSI